MVKKGKVSTSLTLAKNASKRSKLAEQTPRQTDEHFPTHSVSDRTDMNIDETEISDTNKEVDENWLTVTSRKSAMIQKNSTLPTTATPTFFGQPIPTNAKSEGVHSYFSLGTNANRPKPITREPLTYSEGNKRRANLPPFKLEFDAQKKPVEIHVLNELVKHNDRLNVNAASYSTHPLSTHVLLLFANDSPTYETLLDSNSWPPSLCGLSFKVIYPSRTPTSYSVLVNRVPREWTVESIKPLIIQRYLSTTQVTRIFRDGQPINRIRVDFRSHEDVQKILQCSYIAIDSIRYPAFQYKPLTRIDRCFRCQQFGHKATNCTNESKCYKCGEHHQYQRDCSNAVKCANCHGEHMAGSPECPVKISYRQEKRQQQEQNRQTQHQLPTPYLSSPARLYSTVLKTVASQAHTDARTQKKVSNVLSSQCDQTSMIISTLKEEIGRSQTIVLDRITQLEMKCNAVHQQQAALKNTIDTQIIPYMSTMSELLVDVCGQLATAKIITLTNHQISKINSLRQPTMITPVPFSPSFFSSNFSDAYPTSNCQHSTPSKVNCFSSVSDSFSLQ